MSPPLPALGAGIGSADFTDISGHNTACALGSGNATMVCSNVGLRRITAACVVRVLVVLSTHCDGGNW
jgi:hypothetical protein